MIEEAREHNKQYYFEPYEKLEFLEETKKVYYSDLTGEYYDEEKLAEDAEIEWRLYEVIGGFADDINASIEFAKNVLDNNREDLLKYLKEEY